MAGYLTDVEGIKVGHITSAGRPTGCTVILAENGAVAGVDIRGGAPGARETELLDPTRTVQIIHAIAIAGGSAFGLDTAGGVMRFLEEQEVGFDTKFARIPIVPAAIIYDLQLGDPAIRPTAEDGYKAAAAAKNGPFALGSVGAGAGATIGKLFGPDRAMRGGLGSASVRVGRLVVAALAVVNAAGDIVDPSTGRLVGGARDDEGMRLLDSMEAIKAGRVPGIFGPITNTTIGVVATNARLTKIEAAKVAEMAQDGLARAINPIHTPFDGDMVFSLATGVVEDRFETTAIGALAAEMLAEAVLSGVLSAESYQSIPTARMLSSL